MCCTRGIKAGCPGTALLHDARWEIVMHGRLPSSEHVCGWRRRGKHTKRTENGMTSWKIWLRTHCNAARNWCKGIDIEKIVMVQREDGTQTANVDQVHAFVQKACIPIFKMHELGTQPTWEQVEASFAEHIPATCECNINELNGETSQNACKR